MHGEKMVVWRENGRRWEMRVGVREHNAHRIAIKEIGVLVNSCHRLKTARDRMNSQNREADTWIDFQRFMAL